MPGLNRLDYDNDFWPVAIESVTDATVLEFIERNIWLVPMSPRMSDYNVLENTNITVEGAQRLAAATDKCWQALVARDIDAWGAASVEAFNAQIAMYPNMAPKEVIDSINIYKDSVKGYKITGAGGGGFMFILAKSASASSLIMWDISFFISSK